MKLYRMTIENIRTGERKIYVDKRQGSSPSGWKCVGVCGWFEKEIRPPVSKTGETEAV